MVSEQRALQASILATVLLASAGIGFGLYSGSQSIVFDGLFNAPASLCWSRGCW